MDEGIDHETFSANGLEIEITSSDSVHEDEIRRKAEEEWSEIEKNQGICLVFGSEKQDQYPQIPTTIKEVSKVEYSHAFEYFIKLDLTTEKVFDNRSILN